ncbi:MAG: hypothetical protein PWQ09_1164 [Candidatus Cloacimonadota bacterium]|jgi:hypothetical protein|nr:hypothetical protein [Candidatus Cloacimonadota bacterium]
MKEKIPSILKQLKNQNNGYQIKIRYRKNPSGLYRLYLDYWNGQRRETENLKLYISAKSKDLTTNKNVLKLALSIRNKKEIQLMEGNTGIRLSPATGKEINFIEFFKNFASTKIDRNYRISYDHFLNLIFRIKYLTYFRGLFN